MVNIGNPKVVVRQLVPMFFVVSATGFSVLVIVVASEAYIWEVDPVFSFRIFATSFPVPAQSEFRLHAASVKARWTRTQCFWRPIGSVFDTELINGFDCATTRSSPPNFSSCICLFKTVFELLLGLKLMQENIGKLRMLNKRRRRFHSSRVSIYWIWIFGSYLILSNSQSSATLQVRDTCLIVGLRPSMIIWITASLSSNMYNWSYELKKFCACDIVIHIRQFIHFSVTGSFRYGIMVSASDFITCSTSRHLIFDLSYLTVISHCLMGGLWRMQHFYHRVP